MKKIFLVALSALLLISALSMMFCDQDSVDSMVSGIVDAGAQAIGPFFDKAESSTESSQPTDDSSTDDSSTDQSSTDDSQDE